MHWPSAPLTATPHFDQISFARRMSAYGSLVDAPSATGYSVMGSFGGESCNAFRCRGRTARLRVRAVSGAREMVLGVESVQL